MKLLDIKNNLIKLSYSQDEQITLASFIVLTDGDKSYIAQVINLKAEHTSNYAIAKLILVFNNAGILDNFDGSIPSLNASVMSLDANQLIGLLPIEVPIAIGDLAQQQRLLSLDITLLEKRLLICAEKFNNISTIVNNFAQQLNRTGEKVVIIDTDYTFEENDAIKIKRDFKLPLNERFIDYIYENDLEDTDAATKATIEDILSDVRDYAKTVDFIPFEDFIRVISSIYNQTQMPELILLKNKLLKYNEQNLFVQNKEDMDSLKNILSENKIETIDIADISENLQREVILYLQEILDNKNDYIYSFIKLNNKNSDKKLLLKLTNSEKVFSTIICSHAYKYVAELKQLAENLILFAPQTSQHDFAAYNTFLSKLNTNEFVVYGDLTQNIPFVVELAPINEIFEEHPEFNNKQTTEDQAHDEAEISEPGDVTFDELTNVTANNDFEINDNFAEENNDIVEQVAKDVDEAFFSNKVEDIQPIENLLSADDEILTEDDLDFIDELPQDEEEIITEVPVEEDIPTEVTEVEANDETFKISETPEPNFEEQSTVFEPDDAANSEIQQDVEALATNPEESNFDNEAFDIQDSITEEPELTIEGEPAEDLPVFPSEEIAGENTIAFEQGDEVSHPKYGKGIVEKLIKYGNKTLCSISFEEVGRRLLDPNISELQKLS